MTTKYTERRYTFTMAGSHEVHDADGVAELLRSLADLIEKGAVVKGERFTVSRIKDQPTTTVASDGTATPLGSAT